MAQKLPTIAITGANGFLGSKLVEHFSGLGWSIVGLVRDPVSSQATNTSNNVSYRAYDISKKVQDASLKGVDYLVHAAYVKYDSQNPDSMELNLEGAKRLLRAGRSNKIKRTIFISTMSAHEGAISVYGRQKLATEGLFNAPGDVVLKCGLIIGNGGIVKQMSDFMRSKHAVPLIGGGRQPLQIVAVDDLVRTIESIVTQSVSGTYVIATPRVYTYKEFYKALARHLEIKVLYVPVPYSVLQLAFQAAAALHIPLGVGEDNLKGLKMLRAMDSTADLKTLNVTLKELDQALAVITA